jgi:hypothetical protein
MVSNLKKLILIAPEVMHYHKSLKKILKKKGIICELYSTRNKNYQYKNREVSKYLSFISIFNIINSNQNFLVCGNSTLKHVFIIFFLNFFTSKFFFLASDSHYNIKKNKIKSFLKYLFFNLFFFNVSGFVVPGIKTKNYISNFFSNKKFFLFANYPFDFETKSIIRPFRKNNLKILIISRWVKKKNLDFVLTHINFFSLANLKFKIELNIVTDKKFSFIKRKIKMNKNIILKIFGNVNRKSINNLMRKNNILILLSKYEPWGIVIEESGLLKLPSIISKNCGAAELADKNYKGLCNLNSQNFIELIENFSHDLFVLKNVANWIVSPRDLNEINKNIEKFKKNLY